MGNERKKDFPDYLAVMRLVNSTVRVIVCWRASGRVNALTKPKAWWVVGRDVKLVEIDALSHPLSPPHHPRYIFN